MRMMATSAMLREALTGAVVSVRTPRAENSATMALGSLPYSASTKIRAEPWKSPPTEPSGPPSTKDAPTLPEPTLPEPRAEAISSQTAPIPLVSAPAAAPIPLVPTLEATPASDPGSAPVPEGTLRSKAADLPPLLAQIRAAQQTVDAPTMRVSRSVVPPARRGPSLLAISMGLFVVALVLGAAAAWIGLR